MCPSIAGGILRRGRPGTPTTGDRVTGGTIIITTTSSCNGYRTAPSATPADMLTIGTWTGSVAAVITGTRPRAGTITAPRKACWVRCRPFEESPLLLAMLIYFRLSLRTEGVYRGASACSALADVDGCVSLFDAMLLPPPTDCTLRAGTGLPTHHPSETSAKEHDTPPKTPASTSSSDTPNTTSSSSSFASSFAYLLRDNRSDKRLLKRKSKPSQHLTRQPSRPSVEMKRSPSYYKPRVVEDSAIKGQPTRTTPLLSAPSFIAATSNYTAEPNDPKPPSTPSTKRSMSPIRPLQMLSQSQPSTKSDFPSALKRAMTMPKRPALAKLSPALPTVTTSSPSLKTSGALQVRFKTPSIPAAHSMSSALRHNLEDKTRPSKKTHKQDGASMKAHYHDMTPPESEPGIPGHILFHHGDRYFKTFVDEPVPVKESAGASTRDRSNRSTPSTSPGGAYSRLGPARESPTKIPSDPPWSSPVSKRERSSIFKSFRKSAATDSVVEAPNSGIVGTALPHGEAPGILISGP